MVEGHFGISTETDTLPSDLLIPGKPERKVYAGLGGEYTMAQWLASITYRDCKQGSVGGWIAVQSKPLQHFLSLPFPLKKESGTDGEASAVPCGR